MDDFLTDISDQDIVLAKKRIWNRMESKLVDRGFSEYQVVLTALRSFKVETSRLKKVILKERIVDMLPDREPVYSLFSRKALAVSTLSIFFAFLFVPVFQMPKVASAATYNVLELVQGEAFVNGIPVVGSVYVQEGDSIYTSQGSMVHIEFVDDSRMTLGPNSHADLSIKMDPHNRADTEILVNLYAGRAWVQVLNLVNESNFDLAFPDGSVSATQRATFDVKVDDEVEVQVVKNLVQVELNKDGFYNGALGQGVMLKVSDDIETGAINENGETDVWWNFNEAYGELYVQEVDDRYQHERVDGAKILPGNPLYVFKRFRENIQETLALTSSSKEELVAIHAQNRLDEAQVLLEQGDNDGAGVALDAYQEKVDQVENSDNKELLASLDETQKSILAKRDMDEGSQLLEDSLSKASVTISSDAVDKSEVRMLSASQKLARVPELVADGQMDEALDYLLAYQAESMSLLVALEDVSLEKRADVVSVLLKQKLEDLQMLRVISSMGELQNVMDVEAQIYEQLSMMSLALRERSLENLSEFFEATDYDVNLQEDVYVRLQDSAEIDDELTEQFKEVVVELETAEDGEALDVLEVMELTVDPRFK